MTNHEAYLFLIGVAVLSVTLIAITVVLAVHIGVF
jgi:hypothetical protein